MMQAYPIKCITLSASPRMKYAIVVAKMIRVYRSGEYSSGFKRFRLLMFKKYSDVAKKPTVTINASSKRESVIKEIACGVSNQLKIHKKNAL